MGGYDIDPRNGHHLSGEFAKMLFIVAALLEKCTNVDVLKKFLQICSHPMYPDKLWIEPHVYRDAKTVRAVLFSLFPLYINYMEHYILEVIIDKFGNDECRHYFLQYKQMFQRSVSKLREHPAPLSDEEIEQSISGRAIASPNIHTVQEAIRKATGVGLSGQVFAHQDVGSGAISQTYSGSCQHFHIYIYFHIIESSFSYF